MDHNAAPPTAVTRLTRRDPAVQPPALAPTYRSSRLRAPTHPPLRIAPTLTETTGPVFDGDLVADADADLLTNHAAPGETAVGERLIVHGRLTDQDGRGLRGMLIEVWQANAGGRYRHHRDGYRAPLDPNFGGCGRVITGPDGAYAIRTVRPGAYPWPNGGNDWRPSHIHFSVFGTAFGQRLITQMYFEGDPLIARCPILQAIPDAAAIDRLTARMDMARTVAMDARAYRFDIVLRGRSQTPFETRPEGL